MIHYGFAPERKKALENAHFTGFSRASSTFYFRKLHSHLLCEVSLWNTHIYWVFRASSKSVRNFYAVSYLPASENSFKALTNSGF